MYILHYSGLAIKMTQPLYHCPTLNETNLLDIGFPQNLPSIVVSHILDLSPNDTVLDMCAAPGGKTAHIASLMNNKVSEIIYNVLHCCTL